MWNYVVTIIVTIIVIGIIPNAGVQEDETHGCGQCRSTCSGGAIADRQKVKNNY